MRQPELIVWDFDGVSVSLLGRELVVDGLLRVLSVGGLIGFFTNWLAITMLFNPRERRPVFGQGLIPAQRDRVVFRLARAVSEELINEEIIKQKIQESGIIRKYSDLGLEVVRGVVHDPDFRDSWHYGVAPMHKIRERKDGNGGPALARCSQHTSNQI